MLEHAGPISKKVTIGTRGQSFGLLGIYQRALMCDLSKMLDEMCATMEVDAAGEKLFSIKVI